jgi:[acyl-carrier-protein] S-malonyltransferase
MGKIAFLFSGQGAQYSGMGRSLCEVSPSAKTIFELADAVRPNTQKQCFEGSAEELSVTCNTQPCLYCVDLAAASALAENGIRPDGVAGFSLGEVAALTYAGSFKPEDGFRLVCERARLMHDASENSHSGMAAVVKLPNEIVANICKLIGQAYPINYNCPGQLVVATLKDKLVELSSRVKEVGGRAILLPVSGGFHSPFMKSASEGLRAVLPHFHYYTPEIPVYANSTAEPYGAQSRDMLAEQIVRPVFWQKTLENMAGDGFDTFVEVGAGKTLSGFVKKTLPTATVLSVEDAESLAQTLSVLKGA